MGKFHAHRIDYRTADEEILDSLLSPRAWLGALLIGMLFIILVTTILVVGP